MQMLEKFFFHARLFLGLLLWFIDIRMIEKLLIQVLWLIVERSLVRVLDPFFWTDMIVLIEMLDSLTVQSHL